jgi:hypothetical protein
VDFARLADFTNILSTANVPPGTYGALEITLTNPQLIVLSASTNPPSAQNLTTTLTVTSLTITINPALVVTSATTSGLTLDFNLRKSLQLDAFGQVTGTVDPEITVSANTNSGSTVGEADALYGLVGTPSTTNPPSGFTGSFPLTLYDGTGQTLAVLVNGSTVFEGGGATSLSELTANTFVEVDAIVNTNGQIIAQIVDVEGQTSAASVMLALLGKVVNVTRDGSGNATSFTLLVEVEDPNLEPFFQQNGSGGVLYSDLPVTLTSSTNYFTNWRQWNQQSFTFGPKTLGLAQNVAVFGTFTTTDGFAANQVFLRPRNVMGNFKTLKAAGSDGVTGGFTMTPCGTLFGGTATSVLTYPDTVFDGVSGLTALTPTPTLDTVGLLFYEQTSGTATTGGSWTAPTWVMQAREVHQLPN